MAYPASELSYDRSSLEERLYVLLRYQKKRLRWPTGHYLELQRLESRIQAKAQAIEPDAPQTAVAAARRRIAYDDLSGQLARRAYLPTDPSLASRPTRIRIQYLETRILDLAHNLEPSDAAKAIAHAQPLAKGLIWKEKDLLQNDGNPTAHLDERLDRLPIVSRRLEERAVYPRPTAQQRVHQVLSEFRRLDFLDLQRRRVAKQRRRLAFRGNITALQDSLRQTPDPHKLLEQSLDRIYRNPHHAEVLLNRSTRRHGLRTTIDRFGESPAAFGELSGSHFFIQSPARSKALDFVRLNSESASNTLALRERIQRDLKIAESCQRRVSRIQKIIYAHPMRNALLTELGRHMEGLEVKEIQPLSPGDARLLADLRGVEREFLEPLREACRHFRLLDPEAPELGEVAKRIATLYRGTPQHILRRLTPLQKHFTLVAVSMVDRVKKVVSRAARV